VLLKTVVNAVLGLLVPPAEAARTRSLSLTKPRDCRALERGKADEPISDAGLDDSIEAQSVISFDKIMLDPAGFVQVKMDYPGADVDNTSAPAESDTS
jgi:hypothetical protein